MRKRCRIHVYAHTYIRSKENIFKGEVLSLAISNSQWTKARARFTAGIPKNMGINIVGGYIHTHGENTKGARGGGRGTGIKMDGANRMLIERSFIFSFTSLGK